jgi:hypothetical protein
MNKYVIGVYEHKVAINRLIHVFAESPICALSWIKYYLFSSRYTCGNICDRNKIVVWGGQKLLEMNAVDLMDYYETIGVTVTLPLMIEENYFERD